MNAIIQRNLSIPKTPVTSIPQSSFKNIKSIDSVESMTAIVTPPDSKNSTTPNKKVSVSNKYIRTANFNEINEYEGISVTHKLVFN